MSHIVIIGAGITGVTTTDALLECGHTVTVLDRHRYAAMEASFANGGQLSASNAEVWNHTSTTVKGLRWMFRRDAPLLMNPNTSWHKYSWIGNFVRNNRSIKSARKLHLPDVPKFVFRVLSGPCGRCVWRD
jgi:D-amino-acid dehydrogenase